MCSLKPGKVVIVLAGRYAGKKAVVVKAFEKGDKRKFSSVLVAGIAKTPRKVSKTMSKKRIVSRSTVGVFAKFINVVHLMPTRYSVTELDLKSIVVPEKVVKPGEGRRQVKKAVRTAFFNKYVPPRLASSLFTSVLCSPPHDAPLRLPHCFPIAPRLDCHAYSSCSFSPLLPTFHPSLSLPAGTWTVLPRTPLALLSSSPSSASKQLGDWKQSTRNTHSCSASIHSHAPRLPFKRSARTHRKKRAAVRPSCSSLQVDFRLEQSCVLSFAMRE